MCSVVGKMFNSTSFSSSSARLRSRQKNGAFPEALSQAKMYKSSVKSTAKN
jgi:hypothetical protein